MAFVFTGLVHAALLILYIYVVINGVLLSPFYASLAFFYPCYFVWLISATVMLFAEFVKAGVGRVNAIKSAFKFTISMAASVYIVNTTVAVFFTLKSPVLRIAIRSLFLPFLREIAVHFVSESVFCLPIAHSASRALWLLPVYLLFIVSGHAMQLAANGILEAVLMEVPSVISEVFETFEFLKGETPSMVWLRRLKIILEKYFCCHSGAVSDSAELDEQLQFTNIVLSPAVEPSSCPAVQLSSSSAPSSLSEVSTLAISENATTALRVETFTNLVLLISISEACSISIMSLQYFFLPMNPSSAGGLPQSEIQTASYWAISMMCELLIPELLVGLIAMARAAVFRNGCIVIAWVDTVERRHLFAAGCVMVVWCSEIQNVTIANLALTNTNQQFTEHGSASADLFVLGQSI